MATADLLVELDQLEEQGHWPLGAAGAAVLFDQCWIDGPTETFFETSVGAGDSLAEFGGSDFRFRRGDGHAVYDYGWTAGGSPRGPMGAVSMLPEGEESDGDGAGWGHEQLGGWPDDDMEAAVVEPWMDSEDFHDYPDPWMVPPH